MSTGKAPDAAANRRAGAIDLVAHTWGAVVVGALLGLTWSAALRAYMMSLAGSESSFSWWGTFGSILLPGALTGALLSIAWRRAQQGHASAWFALAPAPIALAPLLEPGALVALLTTGLGGGAAGVVITGLIGGFALGQRAAAWLRYLLGAVGLAFLVGFALTPALVAGLPLTTPKGAWLTIFIIGLMLTLGFACTAPFLTRADRESPKSSRASRRARAV